MGLTFTVYGTPKPQGSMRGFRHRTTGKVIVTSDNKRLKPWRQQLSETALHARGPGVELCQSYPVRIDLVFYFRRPKSAKKRIGMTVKPDLDKLQRAVFDALKGILIHDDAQITSVTARKHYGDPERVEITVEELR